MENNYKNSNKKPIKQLDKILGQTIDFIEDGEKEIYEIYNLARQEYEKLELELVHLKVEAAALITAVDKLYQMYDLNRKKLINSAIYSEEELIKLHKETDHLRIKLEEEKNREMSIIRRRNDLEIQLRSTKDLTDRAEKLSSDFSIAISLLNGSIKQITDTIEDINNKQALGVKILQIQEEERRRIAREMHDGLAQQLSQVLINAEFSVKLLDKDIHLAKRELNSLKMELRGSISSIRRLIYNLRPMSLDDLGLVPTIKRDLDIFQKANPNKKIALSLSEPLEEDKVHMSETMILTVYRVFQEAINNIKKHSQAKTVEIDLSVENNNLIMIIQDDGIGINSKYGSMRATIDHGFGLSIMKERVDLLGGELAIFSEKGLGTKISIKIPIC